MVAGIRQLAVQGGVVMKEAVSAAEGSASPGVGTRVPFDFYSSAWGETTVWSLKSDIQQGTRIFGANGASPMAVANSCSLRIEPKTANDIRIDVGVKVGPVDVKVGGDLKIGSGKEPPKEPTGKPSKEPPPPKEPVEKPSK